MAQDAGPSPVSSAQETAPLDDGNTIVVSGARLLDSVDTSQPPVLELESADIAAFGASSIGELLDFLGPSVTSGRGRGGGRPVVLVNGIRVASFRDVRSYPPEAIDRVEVFSEETAQEYGFRPEQRVVNFILKDNFSSREIELAYGQPFRGGSSNTELEGTYLRIDGGRRLNVQLDWERRTALTEAERGIIQSGNVPDLDSDPEPDDFRTLRGAQDEYEATINWSAPLDSDGTTLSLNATLEREDNARLQGLDTVLLTDPDGNSVLRSFNAGDPLTIDTRTDTYALGTSVTTNQSGWRITGTIDAARNERSSVIARTADTSELQADAEAGLLALDAPLDGLVEEAGADFADTRTDSIAALLTARGFIAEVPAGDVSLTVDGGFDWNRIESTDTRNPDLSINLTRGNLNGGLNVTLPLTESGGFGGAIGAWTLNASFGADHLSDFGTLFDWTLGLTWGLTDKLSFSANRFVREAPPGLGQLGNPEIETANVPVFDFVNNETVLASVINGGNADLPAQRQEDWKFGVNWELPIKDDGRLTVDYIRNTTQNLSTGFPVLTPEIEAAFPDRVLRDEDGILLVLDNRPVSFAEQFLERIEVALDLRGTFGANANGGRFGGRFGRRGGGRSDAGESTNPRRVRAGNANAAASDGQSVRQRGDGANEANGSAQRAGTGAAPGIGQGQQRPDAQRMARMRATFCTVPADTLLNRLNAAVKAAADGSEPPVGADGEPIRIPPRMLERLTGPDGTIDPQQVAQARARICSDDSAASGEAGSGARRSGAGQSDESPDRGPQTGNGENAGRAGGARGGPGRGGSDGGRWFANVTYRVDLDNSVLIAPGIAPLDLLGGDAIGATGEPVHTVQFRGGLFYKGFGSFVFGNYTGSSSLDGSGLPGSTDLQFDDFISLNLRAFVDFGEQASVIRAAPFLKGSRFIIRLDNVLDTRQRVTDSSGATPLRFQPFLLDPLGRSFEVEFRKLF